MKQSFRSLKKWDPYILMEGKGCALAKEWRFVRPIRNVEAAATIKQDPFFWHSLGGYFTSDDYHTLAGPRFELRKRFLSAGKCTRCINESWLFDIFWGQRNGKRWLLIPFPRDSRNWPFHLSTQILILISVLKIRYGDVNSMLYPLDKWQVNYSECLKGIDSEVSSDPGESERGENGRWNFNLRMCLVYSFLDSCSGKNWDLY